MDAGGGGPVVVTAAEMVAGHVALDISCLDRLYLNGMCPGSRARAEYSISCTIIWAGRSRPGAVRADRGEVPA